MSGPGSPVEAEASVASLSADLMAPRTTPPSNLNLLTVGRAPCPPPFNLLFRCENNS